MSSLLYCKSDGVLRFHYSRMRIANDTYHGVRTYVRISSRVVPRQKKKCIFWGTLVKKAFPGLRWLRILVQQGHYWPQILLLIVIMQVTVPDVHGFVQNCQSLHLLYLKVYQMKSECKVQKTTLIDRKQYNQTELRKFEKQTSTW